MALDHPLTGETLDAEPARSRLIFAGAMLFLTLIFIGLGTWQVQRLFWKLDLIARVDARVTATPAPAPSSPAWPAINAENDEYRRVTAAGVFHHDEETLVQAVTDLGPGFWILTPLEQKDGTTVLINRGFVPADRRDPAARADGEIEGPVKITGLIRISEPGGAFLRSNDPAGGRWYSRDVAAIAATKGLETAAPYFIDADATPIPGGLPVGGLTVIRFRNSHLVYAVTWYLLAVMSAGGAYAIQRKRLA
ncbi:SURF1 family protein [Neorhizobium galegae]|uniref:SURF1 family protein n=1 Tax=Neorhizobium galegae TaxID=399 RepID=UPI000622B164|nr:SURF1 family protein [Neorhizobium galegae]CDZ56815.1 Surfeit locus 1 family protein [Neorhizobium galegae bv. orientalis]KAB1122876.1 SURF1 family protein [Neorhizobium galegae]MCQ1570141.1 SURF1 family protein [Neorhizobium galegae]MCQ1807675.1 SURF1 family protein [Neorhizobium galegae]MCQ1838245.1 SURF1 family protein [Neorhizobium galegae]